MPLQSDNQAEIEEIWRKVHSTKGLPFPETVGALLELGVTRYAVDYVACTVTTYVANSVSEVNVTKIPDFFSHQGSTLPSSTMFQFDESKLRDAIRRVQAGKGNYRDFANAMVQAGMVGYLAFLTGQRVLYYGEKGETWLELFLAAK